MRQNGAIFPESLQTLTKGGNFPEGSEAGDEFGRHYVAPRDELEEMLVSIWREVLGFEQIGMFDNFFQLNGSSILASQLVSRVKDTYAVDVSIKSFFLEPTIAAMAESVRTLLVEKIKNLSDHEIDSLEGVGK